VALTFKSFVKSTGASVKDTGEFVSGLRTAVNGAKFSAVRARCTSGRRCTTSDMATDVGGGGRGEVGGGTGGGLRSARRGLDDGRGRRKTQQTALARPREQKAEDELCLLTALHHPCFHFENENVPCSGPTHGPPLQRVAGQRGRHRCYRCGRVH